MKKTIAEIQNLILSAEINLENLADQVRGLDQHPFYKIVKYQLRCASSDEDPESIDDVQRISNRSLL